MVLTGKMAWFAFMKPGDPDGTAPVSRANQAAARHLFDWLIMGQVAPLNPAASVRGLDGTGATDDAKGPLLRTIGRGTGRPDSTPLPQANAMVRRRAPSRSTPAPAITAFGQLEAAYLKNGGTLENAAAMANYASTRTTQL